MANDELAKAMATLRRHLYKSVSNISDPNVLLGSFDELNKWFDSMNLLDFDSDINCSGDTLPKSFAQKISELMNRTKMSMIAHPGSGQPPILDLEDELLQALSCFLLVEEDALLKRRDLIYWWTGQGLIDEGNDGEDAGVAADKLLMKLVDVGAIEQDFCIRKNRPTTKYRLIKTYNKDHQNVVMLRKKGTADDISIITDSNGTAISEKSVSLSTIETLLNLDALILNIKDGWLRKMRNLKVLHLGKWSSNDPEQTIEAEQVEFLRSLKYLKKVRCINMKEISRVTELGDEICSLGNTLRVLDLKACPHLEAIPKRIGKLKNLTHLDISQCYLLDRIPKGITSLTKLQVLEGFVISDVDTSSSCKFMNLANHLGTTLRKLSIRTRKMSFPVEDDLKAFSKFEKLLKLKLEWIKVSESDEEGKSQGKQDNTLETRKALVSQRRLERSLAMTKCSAGLPAQLQKLEVQAIPQKAVECLLWRNQRLTQNLKKLYVIGGEVNDLTYLGKVKWKNVKTLHLKYLATLDISWLQLKASFPQVTYLEMTQCPNLTLFPCNHNGIWRDV